MQAEKNIAMADGNMAERAKEASRAARSHVHVHVAMRDRGVECHMHSAFDSRMCNHAPGARKRASSCRQNRIRSRRAGDAASTGTGAHAGVASQSLYATNARKRSLYDECGGSTLKPKSNAEKGRQKATRGRAQLTSSVPVRFTCRESRLRKVLSSSGVS